MIGLLHIFSLLLQNVQRPIYHKQYYQIKYIVTVLKANLIIKILSEKSFLLNFTQSP